MRFVLNAVLRMMPHERQAFHEMLGSDDRYLAMDFKLRILCLLPEEVGATFHSPHKTHDANLTHMNNATHCINKVITPSTSLFFVLQETK